MTQRARCARRRRARSPGRRLPAGIDWALEYPRMVTMGRDRETARARRPHVRGRRRGWGRDRNRDLRGDRARRWPGHRDRQQHRPARDGRSAFACDAPPLRRARDLVAVERVLATEGPVDGLVHVAGGLRVDQWERTEELRLTSFDDVIANNLRSALVTSRAVATRMISSGTPGSIVHVASIAALGALPYGAAYAVAKAGMLALMRTEAVEWGPRGIRVNAVAPGQRCDGRRADPLARRERRPPHSAAAPGRARRRRERGAVPALRPLELRDRAHPHRRRRGVGPAFVSRRHGSAGVRAGRRAPAAPGPVARTNACRPPSSG